MCIHRCLARQITLGVPAVGIEMFSKVFFVANNIFLQFHMQLLVSCHHDCNAAQAYTCPHLYQMASRVRAGALPLPVLVATRTTANVPSALPPL